MEQYYLEAGANRQDAVPMSEKRMVNTIKAIWELTCNLWIRRNEFIHGKNEATKCAKLKGKLDAALDKAFEKDKDDVLAAYSIYSRREPTISSKGEPKHFSTGSKRFGWQQKLGDVRQQW
jgi:hypothetical protein